MATNQVKNITQEQFEAIKNKLANGGVLTAQEWQDLSAYGTHQAQEEQKTEALVADVLKDLEEAKIDPKKLTAILAEKGLIVLPQPKATVGKVVIYESEKTTFPNNSRATVFKIWKGRDLSNDTKDAQDKWATIKLKGKDAFIARLNAEGRDYYSTEEGKKYIDGLFA